MVQRICSSEVKKKLKKVTVIVPGREALPTMLTVAQV